MCNPGLILQLYMNSLNPKQNRLFQRPKSDKNFNIHDVDNSELYENAPVGKNQIPKLLKRLCETVGHPPLGNHSIRVTVIRYLKKMNFQDREIMAVSGNFDTPVISEKVQVF